MTTVSLNNDFGHLQDLLGSLPMLRGFIPICVCFELNDAMTIPRVEESLTCAASKLGQAFPFLTGRVLIDGIKQGHSGVPKIVRHGDKIQLSMNDLTKDGSVVSAAEMKKESWPKSMLDPKLLLPRVCLGPYPMDSDLFAPVFMIQANYVRGGLLLTFVGNHQIMDATGLGYFVELYAKALRGEDFTKDDIETTNQPRGAVIPLLGDDYQPGPELDDIIPAVAAASGGLQHPTEVKPNMCAWFRITSTSLERLKSNASEQDVAPYISTDDAVSALFWQAVSRARRPRLGRKVTTKFARPISARKLFGLKRYTGHMVVNSNSEGEDVYLLPLGTVAGQLRLDLLQDNKIRYHAQALATMCSRLSDRSNLVYGANGDLNRDLLLTSWTQMGTCGYSYGDVLGFPKATRCPWKIFDIPMIIVLPKDRDGSMTLVLCFAEDEMGRMLKDETLLSYGQWLR